MMEEWQVGLLAFVAMTILATLLGKKGPRKTHDVDCKFRTGSTYHGDLDQSRWSDGRERVEMNLRKLPDDYSGPVRMLQNGQHVADFEAKTGTIRFNWKGEADGDSPLFEVGDEIVLELGPHQLTGIVKKD